jgi:hypothetical protein
MNHAKTSFSTEIFAGAIISVVQYLAPLRYMAEHHQMWKIQAYRNNGYVLTFLVLRVGLHRVLCWPSQQHDVHVKAEVLFSRFHVYIIK